MEALQNLINHCRKQSVVSEKFLQQCELELKKIIELQNQKLVEKK